MQQGYFEKGIYAHAGLLRRAGRTLAARGIYNFSGHRDRARRENRRGRRGDGKARRVLADGTQPYRLFWPRAAHADAHGKNVAGGLRRKVHPLLPELQPQMRRRARRYGPDAVGDFRARTKGRAIRQSGFPREFPFTGGVAISDAPTRFRDDFTPDDFVRNYTVRPTDIDFGRHMNNVAYIRVLLDCFSAKQIASGTISSIEAHYASPCLEGETLSVYQKQDGDTVRIAIKKQDGKPRRLGCRPLYRVSLGLYGMRLFGVMFQILHNLKILRNL